MKKQYTIEEKLFRLKGHNDHWFDGKVEVALQANADVDKDERLSILNCPYCYYFSSGFGGAAMTNWNCALCDKHAIAGSTNHDTLCEECAKKYNRCRNCGDKMFEVSKK